MLLVQVSSRWCDLSRYWARSGSSSLHIWQKGRVRVATLGRLFLWIMPESLAVLLHQFYSDVLLNFHVGHLDLHSCEERKARHCVYLYHPLLFLYIWPLEAGNALAAEKDVIHFIQREPFLQVGFSSIIGPQISTLYQTQGAFPVKLLKYSADEINIYRKQWETARC